MKTTLNSKIMFRMTKTLICLWTQDSNFSFQKSDKILKISKKINKKPKALQIKPIKNNIPKKAIKIKGIMDINTLIIFQTIFKTTSTKTSNLPTNLSSTLNSQPVLIKSIKIITNTKTKKISTKTKTTKRTAIGITTNKTNTLTKLTSSLTIFSMIWTNK